MLWNIDETVLFVLAIAAFLTVIELCFRLGLRRRGSVDDASRSHTSALQAALLGLLSLLLGFNFAMAASRFDARKVLIQEEVNAIRTTHLRAQLLPAPWPPEVQRLLQSYVSTRIDFMKAGDDKARIAKASAASARIEDELWAHTSAMVAQHPGAAMSMGWFVLSLNEMIGASEKRRAALDNNVPELVIVLLFTVAIGAMGFIGYGYGLTGTRRHGATAIFAVLIALVLATILDLDRPRRGFIRVGEDSLLRLDASLSRGGVDAARQAE